jgi:hypothetical protein
MSSIANQTDEETAAPVLIKANNKDGKIRAEVSDAEISALVSAGRVVILKVAFESEQMIALRHATASWDKETAPFPHGTSPNAHPTLNYHRIDDGRIVSSLPHVFHQNCFNDLLALTGELGKIIRPVAETMRDLQNRIADTKFAFDLDGLRVKVLRYPRGGGYLSEHEHPLEPQRLGLILNLSRIGEDFVTGGTTFRTPFGCIDTNETHDLGEIIIFRYNLAHAVARVDPGQPIAWDAESGKWSMLLELRETHGQSTAKL